MKCNISEVTPLVQKRVSIQEKTHLVRKDEVKSNMAKAETKTKTTVRVQHNSNLYLYYKKELPNVKTQNEPNYQLLNIIQVFLHFKSYLETHIIHLASKQDKVSYEEYAEEM